MKKLVLQECLYYIREYLIKGNKSSIMNMGHDLAKKLPIKTDIVYISLKLIFLYFRDDEVKSRANGLIDWIEEGVVFKPCFDPINSELIWNFYYSIRELKDEDTKETECASILD